MLEKISSLKIHSILAIVAVLCLGCRHARAAEAAKRQDVQFISQPVHMAPYVSISVVVKAGVINETKSSVGWRQLLATAMMRGTAIGDKSLDGAGLRKAAEAAGGDIGVQVLEDAIVFTAAGDSARQKDLAQLLLNVVLHPRLSHEDLSAARRITLRRLGANPANAMTDNSAAVEKLQSMLYSDSVNSLTYGLPSNGTVDSLSGFTDDRAREYHKFYFTAPNIVVSCSGDVDEAALREVFSSIPQGVAAPASAPKYAKPEKVALLKKPVDAPWLLVGYRVDSSISDKDLAALRVLTAALSATSPSLLSKVFLMPHDGKDHSLASTLSAQLMVRQYGSELVIAIQSDSAHLSETTNMIYPNLLKVLLELKSKPLTPQQLQEAIAYVQGDWAASNDSHVSRSMLQGYAAAQQVPVTNLPQLLQEVTAKDVQNVAGKYLGTSAAVMVLPETNASPVH